MPGTVRKARIRETVFTSIKPWLDDVMKGGWFYAKLELDEVSTVSHD